MNSELCIRSEEVLADIRSAAWLEQELHPALDRHRRHQMADICEDGNAERVWRVLGSAVAEVRFALLKILNPSDCIVQVNELERPGEWTFSFSVDLPADILTFLKEKIHGYLVASVMADRCGVIIREAAPIWQDRAEEAMAMLRGGATTAFGRFNPVRRPLWPLPRL